MFLSTEPQEFSKKIEVLTKKARVRSKKTSRVGGK